MLPRSQPEEVRVLVPGGAVGYGFDKEIFRNVLARQSHVIAYDAGSIDPDPYYLGEGVPFVPRLAAKIDIDILIEQGRA